VVVTGGCGFIGSHLVSALSRCCRVRVVDDLSTGRHDRIAHLRADFERLSVLDPLDRVLAGADVVFHLAAQVSLEQSLRDPVADARINVLGTLQVLEGCRRNGVRRIVYASSSAVYADSPRPCRERDPLAPATAYGAAKAAGEAYAAAMFRTWGLEAVGLRLFNVYGPGQEADGPDSGVVATFVDRAVSGRGPVIHGDGRQTRDFIHVEDVVRAFILGAVTPGVGGGVFNVGTGVPTAIARLASLAGAGRTEHGPGRTGDVRTNYADTDLARSVLGFEAQVGLRQGLAALVAAAEGPEPAEEGERPWTTGV